MVYLANKNGALLSSFIFSTNNKLCLQGKTTALRCSFESDSQYRS